VPRPIDIDDFSKIMRLSDPQISPDGARVAFTATRTDLEKNDYFNEIHIVDASSSETLGVLSSGSDSMPRWSPDGRALAFISRRGFKEKERGAAIYEFRIGGGEPRLIARFKHGITDLKWFPDGIKLVVLAPVPIRRIDEDQDYIEVHDLPVWFNGKGFVDEYREHLFIVDKDSGTVKQLTNGSFRITHFSIDPSGRRLLAVVQKDWRNPLISQLIIIDAETGSKSVVLDGGYSISAAEWSPDGSMVVMQANTLKRGLASHDHVWLVDPKSGEARCVTCKLDRNTHPSVSSDIRGRGPSHPRWTREGVYFLINNGGRVNLHVYDPAQERIEKVTAEEHVVYAFTADPSGRRLAMGIVGYTEPPEVYVYEKGGTPRKITRFNEWLLREVRLQRPVGLKVRTSDGESVEGWYIPPLKRNGGKAPVVLTIHGGPKSSYGAALNFFHQLLAAKGYYVVYCNPRGSDGYSEEFADIRCRYGERDYQDIMEFLDEFLRRVPDADPERMAVMGISYGGFMVNWIVTKTDRFKAAISENGISMWHSDFYTSDIGYWFDQDQICGTPFESRESYDRQSPITYVDRVKTPLLIIHSMEDYRCFIEQSLAMHVALRLRGKESRLVVFLKGDHGHSITGRPRHRRKRYKLILSFLEEKLLTKRVAETSERGKNPRTS
jgi:acylaminoacyl-peptidase